MGDFIVCADFCFVALNVKKLKVEYGLAILVRSVISLPILNRGRALVVISGLISMRAAMAL